MTSFGGGHGRRATVAVAIGVLLAIGGVACLIAGIVLVKKSANEAGANQSCGKPQNNNTCKPTADTCSYSAQANTSGLAEFFEKVRNTYYDVKPYKIAQKHGATLKEIRTKYKVYDPSPRNLKYVNDKAKQLLAEVRQLKIEVKDLKPREKKALSQVKHFLQHVFGRPYDAFYYGGSYLLGPNLFCWQEICDVADQVTKVGELFKPKTANDLEIFRDKLMMFNHTFTQYKDNLKYGVEAGMVRSVEECDAGYKSFSRHFPQVASDGAKGIFSEGYATAINDTSGFLSAMSSVEKQKWQTTHSKDAESSVRDFLLEYVGKPLDSLLSYLKGEHRSHCVPSSVSSGLATLPLAHVYTNGLAVPNVSTTQKLPTGEKLDGRMAYGYTLSYFTTTDLTADQVHELGLTMLKKLWPQIEEVAYQVTNKSKGESNNMSAIDYLKMKLNASDAYFADSIPANESNDRAHSLCKNEKNAAIYCPTRWQAIQKWFKVAREVMSKLQPKTLPFFHFTGDKRVTPSCPVEMRPNFNPAMGAQSYSRSNNKCSKPCFYNIPFFLGRPGSKYSEWSINAHEAIPGHHTQVQGSVEFFKDTCDGDIGWLDSVTSYTAFSEGWGLYAESPLIGEDTDTYVGEPLYKYGMLKSQIWRALRLIVDTGLHYKNMNRTTALKYFTDYAFETGDRVEKEITRYQSDPGQATSYMVGQLRLIQIRDYVKKELGPKFNMKDFHFYLLAQGSSPLSYLEESMKEYVRCVKKYEESCYYVLNPVAKNIETARQKEAEGRDLQLPDEFPEEHYF